MANSKQTIEREGMGTSVKPRGQRIAPRERQVSIPNAPILAELAFYAQTVVLPGLVNTPPVLTNVTADAVQ